MNLKKAISVVLLGTLLTACGGGKSDAPTPTDTTAPNAPSAVKISSASNGSITVSGSAEANSIISVTFPDGSKKSGTANASGVVNFSLNSAASQPEGIIEITSADSAGNISETTVVSADTVIRSLYKATGTMPKLSFSPSLGINTEAPQGGADTAGMPMPFVDIFRTARPFAEQQKKKKDAQGKYLLNSKGRPIYIKTDNKFDANGWVTEIDPETKLNSTEPEIRSSTTKMLQGALKGSIPEGKYTLIYEGSGTIEFSPSGALSRTGIKKVPNENRYILDVALHDFADPENEQETSSKNQLAFGIKDITSSNYIKNIRIIMPGGTCTGNPFIRVNSNDECPNGSSYESFEERLQADRNAIIFNPDYLMFLRNFKVIRMMNLMEASLKKLCFTKENCPAGVGTWDHRAKIDDAVWGGNDGRTSDEDHNGVPVEVMIALANTLQKDIWINMPHVASDDYVTQYAKQVYAELDSSLKVYLEYSNEVWNSGFAGYSYAVSEGIKLNLNTVPAAFQGSIRDENYFARLRFYSQRAVEIFNLWKAEFGGSNARTVRVLGSFIGDKVLTDQMLKNVVTTEIDAVAIAPYFFGCPYDDICRDAPKTLLTATTVDDIFDIIDQDGNVDVKSLDGTINAVKNQLTVTQPFDIKLISYEGGQHLVTGVLSDKVADSDKPRLRKLFNEANRDPRMKQRYMRFLNAWKDLSDDGTALFTLYTLPQSFYRFGNFGIKEHLNMTRAESPKFDGAMTFQESVKTCWWDGCNP